MTCLSTMRMKSLPASNATDGIVYWTPLRSIWTLSLTVIGIIGGIYTFSADALLLFLATTAITICCGHSVGMHRLLIHRSFTCPKWLEYSLVYLGVLVGMAGPHGMIYAHDIRDWAQRQNSCHDLFAHRSNFFIDAFWQMHCAVSLKSAPLFQIETDIKEDRFYRFLERSWMLQQLPWAILFYYLGGISWLIWGIPLRIAVSLTGHWLIGHYSHRKGHQGWRIKNVAVQGYNIPYLGLITFGECWHGNHHAFPGSAKLGVETGQTDPGWWLISLLKYIGLAWNIKEPSNLPQREGIERVDLFNKKENSETQNC